jgi:hypothetical protein
MGIRANPAFAAGAVVVPVVALVYAVLFGTPQQHTYVHVMAGVLWTGIDLFMAIVFGPVLGSLTVDEPADAYDAVIQLGAGEPARGSGIRSRTLDPAGTGRVRVHGGVDDAGG